MSHTHGKYDIYFVKTRSHSYNLQCLLSFPIL